MNSSARVITESPGETLTSPHAERLNEPKPIAWICSPLWDVTFIFSGLWLSLIIGGLSCFGFSSAIIASRFWYYMTLFFWAGHNLSPVVAAWSIPSLRQRVLLKKPAKYILLPSAVVGSCLVLGLSVVLPSLYAPSSKGVVSDTTLPELGLFYLFFFWNSYHFAWQHFGILQIYAHRSPARDRACTRSRDRSFCLITTCGLLPLAWYTQSQRWGILLNYLPTVQGHGVLAQMVVVVGILLTLRVCAVESRDSGRYSPRFFFLLSVGLQPVCAVLWYPLFSMASFTLCHWIAAVALSSHIVANGEAGEASYGGVSVGFRFCRQLLLLVLISVPLSYLFMDASFANWLARLAGGFGYLAPADLQKCFSKLLLFGYFGFGFVHFLYDRYLYEFRNQDVRAIVGSRLYGSREVLQSRASA